MKIAFPEAYTPLARKGRAIEMLMHALNLLAGSTNCKTQWKVGGAHANVPILGIGATF